MVNSADYSKTIMKIVLSASDHIYLHIEEGKDPFRENCRGLRSLSIHPKLPDGNFSKAGQHPLEFGGVKSSQ